MNGIDESSHHHEPPEVIDLTREGAEIELHEGGVLPVIFLSRRQLDEALNEIDDTHEFTEQQNIVLTFLEFGSGFLGIPQCLHRNGTEVCIPRFGADGWTCECFPVSDEDGSPGGVSLPTSHEREVKEVRRVCSLEVSLFPFRLGCREGINCRKCQLVRQDLSDRGIRLIRVSCECVR